MVPRAGGRNAGSADPRSLNGDTPMMKISVPRRYIVLLFGVLLVTGTGCDAKFTERQETDAELFCRQSGYGYGGTAYLDCVEERSVVR